MLPFQIRIAFLCIPLLLAAECFYCSPSSPFPQFRLLPLCSLLLGELLLLLFFLLLRCPSFMDSITGVSNPFYYPSSLIASAGVWNKEDLVGICLILLKSHMDYQLVFLGGTYLDYLIGTSCCILCLLTEWLVNLPKRLRYFLRHCSMEDKMCRIS